MYAFILPPYTKGSSMHTSTDLVLLIGTNPLPNYVVAEMGNSRCPDFPKIPISSPQKAFESINNVIGELLSRKRIDNNRIVNTSLIFIRIL
jgi:hypothetical protein